MIVFASLLSLLFLSLLPSILAHPALHATRQIELATNTTSPTVGLDYATYRGVRLSNGVDQFLGMRFAKPPLDDLRFRAPEDPVQELGVQDASKFGPLCIGVGQNASDPTLSEDCLTVNVWTPSSATQESKLPVWLFIQGGGYAVVGSSFNGTGVVKESDGNMIFASFNYRCGALGFLASEKVRANGNLNAGLLDQRKAMEWVQSHITKFGGDPAKVVIHGPSAGAGSVEHHLTAFDGAPTNLFIGAIAQSSFWPTQRPVSDLEFQYDRLVVDTNCFGANDTLACLRAADLATIQKGNVNSPFPEAGANPSPLWYWLPCTEGAGELVPDNLYNSFAAGKFVKVPLLIGNDNDEGTIFVTNASTTGEVSTFLKNNFPKLSPDQLDDLLAAYPLVSPNPFNNKADFFPSLAAAYGESTFLCPGNTIAAAMASALSPDQVWNYRVNVQDPVNTAAGIGVPHVFESAAVFGPENLPPGTAAASWSGSNKAIVPVFMNYWISFVRNLDPNTFKADGAPNWETWGEGDGQRLKLQTNATAMEEVPQGQVDRCEVWRGLSNVTQQ